jgi:hypothetical protein
VLDLAGCADEADDLGDAAEGVLERECPRHVLGRFDAVLKR